MLWDGAEVPGDDPSAAVELVREQQRLAVALARFGWDVVEVGADRLARDLDGVVRRVLGGS